MDYHPTWNLTTIPSALLWREAARRASEQSSGREVSCTCGECGVCRQRLYRRVRRKAGKDLPKERGLSNRSGRPEIEASKTGWRPRETPARA